MAPAVPVELAWERALREAGAQELLREPAPRLLPECLAFFFFLNGQARFSHLGFPPLRNPQREEPLTPLLWPLPCTPLPVPFPHTSHYQHISGERGALLGRRSWGGKLSSVLGPLCFPTQPLGGGKERDLNFHMRALITSPPRPQVLLTLLFEWRGGEGPTRSSVVPGLGMGPLRTSLLLLANGPVADKGPKTVSLGRMIRTEIPTPRF